MGRRREGVGKGSRQREKERRGHTPQSTGHRDDRKVREDLPKAEGEEEQETDFKCQSGSRR